MHDELLEKHLSLVIEANKTTNITRISSWEDGMLLHVKDSLLGLDALNACPAGRYADIGTARATRAFRLPSSRTVKRFWLIP